jgi:hypothetical protein
MSGFWETLTDAFEEARSDLTDSRTVEEAARLEKLIKDFGLKTGAGALGLGLEKIGVNPSVLEDKFQPLQKVIESAEDVRPAWMRNINIDPNVKPFDLESSSLDASATLPFSLLGKSGEVTAGGRFGTDAITNPYLKGSAELPGGFGNVSGLLTPQSVGASWESENEIFNAQARHDRITGGTTVSGGLKVNF